MKSEWNKRAKHDPFYYVETKHWDGDIDAFFKLGEERAGVLLKPVLDQLAIDATEATALDLGCGIGRFSRVLAKSFRQVVAVDVSDEMIAQARGQNSACTNISFLPTDGLTLPIGSETVDFVWSYEVFQHMPTHKII
jgi:ubiquinone/menaquinone biosynthesis C-methylase UbiE